MKDGRNETVCPVCRERRSAHELVPGRVLNEATADLVTAEDAGWSNAQEVCIACLTRMLARAAEPEETAADPAPDDPSAPCRRITHEEMLRQRTLGERTSDAIAAFVGSWAFLNVQIVLLFIWIAFNSVAIFTWHFDPYPFILLNLVLSWIGALQAPLILMSQNRQDTRDRLRDESEYRTNLAAEREIHQLHEKLDHLIAEHWPLLVDIHRQQVALSERLKRAEE